MGNAVLPEDQDRADILATLAGDDGAYARLLARYEPDIAKQMWRFTHDRDEHEQLVHDVFVEAFFSLNTFRAEAPFPHWLRRVATHVGYGFWRQRTKSRKVIPLENPDVLPAKQETRNDPEMGKTLFGLLEKLRPDERLVLTLTYDEELNAKEIAERMGWTHVMTRKRISRARDKLRTLAEQAGIGKAAS